MRLGINIHCVFLWNTHCNCTLYHINNYTAQTFAFSPVSLSTSDVINSLKVAGIAGGHCLRSLMTSLENTNYILDQISVHRIRTDSFHKMCLGKHFPQYPSLSSISIMAIELFIACFTKISLQFCLVFSCTLLFELYKHLVHSFCYSLQTM